MHKLAATASAAVDRVPLVDVNDLQYMVNVSVGTPRQVFAVFRLPWAFSRFVPLSRLGSLNGLPWLF